VFLVQIEALVRVVEAPIAQRITEDPTSNEIRYIDSTDKP